MVSKKLLRDIDEQLSAAIKILREGSSSPLFGILSNVARLSRYTEKVDEYGTSMLHSDNGGYPAPGSNGRSVHDNSRRQLGTDSQADSSGESATEPIVNMARPTQKSSDPIIYGVLLVPDEADLDGESFSAELVADTCAEYSKTLEADEQHRFPNSELEVADSFISPEGYTIDGHTVKPGSWIVGIRSGDEEVIRKVKSGDYRGLSIDGTAMVRSGKSFDG